MSGHQCAQTLPPSTSLTARPIWDKTKNKRSFSYEKRCFSKDDLQGIVTLCFISFAYLVLVFVVILSTVILHDPDTLEVF